MNIQYIPGLVVFRPLKCTLHVKSTDQVLAHTVYDLHNIGGCTMAQTAFTILSMPRIPRRAHLLTLCILMRA